MNARQQRFVTEYLIDLNATHAAVRAGYSPKTARSIGQQLLTKLDIQHAISIALDARSARTKVTADAVLAELKTLDFSDVSHYAIDDRGNVQLTEYAPSSAMRAVSSLRKRITHSEDGITYDTEIRLWNKPAALKMSGQHLGLFEEQVKVDVSVSIQVQQQEQQQAAQQFTDRLNEIRSRTLSVTSTQDILPDGSIPA